MIIREGLIFDIDGTILDSMLFWETAPRPYLNSIGIELDPEIGKATLYKSLPEIALILKKEYQLKIPEDEIIAGILGTIADFYKYQVGPKEGAEQTLKTLKEAGFKVTAATFSDKRNVENALGRLHMLQYFDRILTCAEVGSGKEKPDIYFAAAAYMNTSPIHTWVVEDSLYAIKTAKKAGFKTIGVYDLSSDVDQDEIKRLCDVYLGNLTDADLISYLGR